jgi:hypothetical protein
MVVRPSGERQRRGSLQMDCLVALGLLMTVVLPLAYGFLHSQRLMRQTYQRAVVVELIDGELEVLARGEWRAFPLGTVDYPLRGGALTNVPPGRFILTRTAQLCRLDWQPADARQHVPFGREIALKGGQP